MIEYEWGSPSHILLPSSAADDSTSSAANSAAHQHHILGPFSAQAADDSTPTADFPPPHPCFPFNSFQQHYNHHFIDPRAFAGASYPPPQPPGPFMMPSDLDPAGFMMVPKPEPAVVTISEPGRIGLNLGLGGRTYFSAADEDFVSRLYRRSRALDGGPAVANSPRCQAEGCNADLTHAKHYHRRHKVCEFHSKASTVVAAGLTQRFCQQCSRFHLLTEFDNGKRSCRRRLADHNRRRRKSHQPAALQDRRPPQLDNTTQNSSRLENPPRSPSDSGTVSVSSAAVAVSSPFRSIQESRSNGYNSSAASSSVSTSSNSMFY